MGVVASANCVFFPPFVSGLEHDQRRKREVKIIEIARNSEKIS